MHTTTGKNVALATLLAGILLSLGSGSIAFAQDYQDWKFTHPKPQPNLLRKHQMIDANTWVAVGGNGTFMRTTDAGATWYFHHQAGLPTNNALSIGGNSDVLFTNGTNGIVAGAAGYVGKTSNGGVTLNSVPNPVPATQNCKSISFADANTGYIAAAKPGGFAGTIIKTTDGGSTWTSVYTATDASVNALVATSATTVHAVRSEDGSVINTTDGGLTWSTPVPNTVGQSMLGMSFLDSMTGFVVGSNGGMSKTTDGGATWATLVTPQTLDPFFQMKIISAVEIYAVGSEAYLYKSTDLGATWTALPILPVAGVTDTLSWYSLEKQGSVMTMTGDFGLVIKSTDGGASWSSNNFQLTTSLMFDIREVPNTTTVVAVGRNWVGAPMSRQVLRSTNMGNSWSAIDVPVSTDLQSVSFVNSQLGYACGTNSQVVKTTDAGLTWAAVTPPSATSYTLQAVEFVDANTGWVFVNFVNVPGGNIFKTTDGGTTWTQQSLGTTEQRIASADMVDANVGYLTLNPSGQPIYKTTNGGTTWTPVTIPFTGQIKTVRAVDANLVYIGANSGPGNNRVGKSTDGGASWTQIALPATVDVVSLDFKDANTGYVCGNSSATAICKTTDGGATWSFENSHTNTLVRVYAGPSGTGWALGASASILRWVTGFSGNSPTPTPSPTATATATVPPTPSPTPTPTPTPTPPPPVCSVNEAFTDITTLPPAGWVQQNNSSPMGTSGWFQGNTLVFTSAQGDNSYIAANFNNTSNLGTISNWLLTPPITVQNGGELSFWTRTADPGANVFPDRLQVRMSTNGTSQNVGTTATSVGDFSTLLLDINPTYTATGYPLVWTNYTVTLSGIGSPVTGRLAFRYFVENGGPAGANSDYIGIDSVQYDCNPAVPTPTPTPTPPPPVCTLTQGFDDITTLPSLGWVQQNNSSPIGLLGWFQGNTAIFNSQQGNPDSYIGVNYNSGANVATISNWLLTPPITLQNGAVLSFWTRTLDGLFPDRLQVRMSTNGNSSNVGSLSTDVGDFTTLLLDINPTYTTTDYPIVWTNFTIPITGIGSPTQGRLAFRYFVENGGPDGANSDYIGIDTVQYDCGVATPTPSPTATATATVPPTFSISGTLGQCNTTGPSGILLPGVTMTLTGAASGSTTTDASGNYSFSGLFGGNYTVTPSKAARPPGSSGINTTDVIAVQRHFLQISLLSGCRLTAADCAAPVGITTADVIAIQRFFLVLSTGIGNVGKYSFTPANRVYSPLGGNQTGQNFDTVVFGDVATPFGFPRPGDPPPTEEPVVDTDVSVTLPNVSSNQSKTSFSAPVKTSRIDAKSNIVGFQGDFTFDERVVTFSDPERPVQNAGLTVGNWNVSGHVLPGNGPIKTLRVSAYSTDFKPLEGTGTLFELRIQHVNNGAGSSPLLWAAPPDNFTFINSDLQSQRPGNTFSGSVAPAQR